MPDKADVALIVSSPESAGVHPDHEIGTVAQALEGAGLRTAVVPWTADLDWADYSAVVLKSPWDYSMRAAEFSRWLDDVESRAVVLNHPKIIRWNFDKRYLGDLRDGGIDVTPFACVGSRQEADTQLAALANTRVVIKPSVSAGSRNTGLFETRDPAALDLVDQILRLGKTPMITPALDAVERDGEHGLLFFGGEYSHCGRKAPILACGGGYLEGEYTELVVSAEPPDDEVELGERCLRLVADLATRQGVPPRHATPLYARIDIARDQNDRPCILEAELFEPSHFTHLDSLAADRFATALCAYVD